MATSPAETTSDELETVLRASQAFGHVIAESLASVGDTVTMPQLRVLILASRCPVNVTAVAQDLDVHPSNATRTCDRLVRAGLLDRRPDERDRRQVVLSLTPEGEELVDKVMDHRRRIIAEVMGQMSGEHRRSLVKSMAMFADLFDSTDLAD